MSDEINFLGLFDKYMTKEVEVCQMADEQHFLVDLYVNELWEVKKCYPKKYYDEKRKQWFEFEPVKFICNTKQFGSPNGYFTMELKPIIETILQKDYKIQSAVEELELDICWLKDLEDYVYLFGHKGEMLNRITMRKEYQNKRLKELKED
jgi:hypothetical protein